MGKMEWTKEQQKVIDLRNRNILVSAAAGSGKTAVLVERIITMVTDPEKPVDIDRLLIVTFTEAAAGEMRERIGKAIEQKLIEEPDNMHLQKQEALLHSARITTIHSFCLGVIRNYFNTIDLDPSFRIGDETELKLLKSDVLSELLEEKYEEGEENFYRFIETYATGKSDAGIEEMILNFHSFSMSYPWPKQWMEKQRQVFFVDSFEEMEGSLWMKLLMEHIRCQIESFCTEYEQLFAMTEEADGPYMYAEVMERELAALHSLEKAVHGVCPSDTDKQAEKPQSSYRTLGRELSVFKWERLSSKKDESVNADKRELVKEKRSQIKKELDKIGERYFYQSPEEMVQDMQNVRAVMNVLIDLAETFTERYQAKKEERGIVDFNDLEHFALEILVKPKEKTEGKESMDEAEELEPTAAARELQEVYAEILIDEYQDSNYVQEAILKSISKVDRGEPNIFMVGDVKQSIYKFRLARPELFMQKYEEYTTEDSLYQKIDLQKNFRSRPVVLHGINYIFEGIMRKELGNISYDTAARLNPGAVFEPLKGSENYKTELLLVENTSGDKRLTAQEIEARVIAKRIKEYVSGGMKIWDKEKKAYRNAVYSDIVILLRSPKSWTDKMTEMLKAEGIPAAANVQTGYFSALEVRTILNYLLVIDNPLQDIPLTGTLTSFIGNFTEKELGEIRKSAEGETVYESLKHFVQGACAEEKEENTDLLAKVRAFLEELSYFRERSAYTGVYDMIQEIYEKTKIYDYVSVLPGGSVRKGNLDMLLQKAVDFEATSYGGLFHFNRYIERLHEYAIDFGEAKGTEGSDNVVTLMSIHKSKGLEFPIVFLAGLFKSFNKQDARSRLVLHPDLGIGPDYVDYKLRTKSPTLIKKVIQRQLELENLSEELRILYVALTRAKEKLILTGSTKDLEKVMEKWRAEKELSYRSLTQAGSYSDWVGPRVLHGMEKSGEKQCDLFAMHLYTAEDLVEAEVFCEIDREGKKEELLNWADTHPLSEKERERLAFYINFVYPYQADEKIKSKLSVSELKRLYQQEEEEPGLQLYEGLDTLAGEEAYIPDFARTEETVTGAGRGTVYHKIMEYLVFQRITDKADIRQQLDEMEEKKVLLSEERSLVDVRKLTAFFASDLGKRMKEADKKGGLYKEKPFVMGIPARETDESIDSGELVLVQGMIDAYFEEEDGLVLVDYKTDRVEKAEELTARYSGQLTYYQKALEQITGKRVKEKMIYSFYLGEEIS